MKNYSENKKYFEEQVISNLKDEDFETDCINILITEILTKLICKDYKDDRYTEEIYPDCYHQYIQDLDILYRIRKEL